MGLAILLYPRSSRTAAASHHRVAHGQQLGSGRQRAPCWHPGQRRLLWPPLLPAPPHIQPPALWGRPRASPQPCSAFSVWTISDIHVDYPANLGWLQGLEPRHGDVLILAGDVADDLQLLESALALLAQRFALVFYCVGNHELWLRGADRAAGVQDSTDKLRRVLDICARLGVATSPRRLGNLWVVPMHSWHHCSFDPDPDIAGGHS